jgi:hypothetical protein
MHEEVIDNKKIENFIKVAVGFGANNAAIAIKKINM